MIRFRVKTTLQIIENYDERSENVDDFEETFEQGEEVDAEIFSEYDGKVDIQFGDGSISLGVFKEEIEEI